ncbi:MAG: hypothetical protein WA990_10865 [Rubrobacteraceae bacterium]
MAEVEKRKARGGWRYASGVVSLALAGFSGFCIVLLAGFSWVFGAESLFELPGAEGPGAEVAYFLLTSAMILSALASLLLAAIALLKPGRGWRTAVAGWTVGVSVLLFAGSQAFLGDPYETESGEFSGGPGVADEMGIPEEEMMMEDMGAPPGTPPQAILTSDRRDSVGLEGTFCWTPGWAENCVEDAGIPLPGERDALAVKQDENLHLVFSLRGWEGRFDERDPEIAEAVAYTLDQETDTLPMPPEDRYLVPAGSSRKLTKEPLVVKGGSGEWKIAPDVPTGEYVFQVAAKSPEPLGEVETWSRATYHFRVKVLPGDGG